MVEKNKPFQICNLVVQPGEQVDAALPMPEIFSCGSHYVPLKIYNGKKAGPVLLICSGLLGDEMNGIAIIQRLLSLKSLKAIYGTLLIVPMVNVYSLLTGSRNLPDHRDLESSFPGKERGTYASRMAHSLSELLFSRATHCVTLRTGSTNFQMLPSVYTDSMFESNRELAEAFGANLIIHEEKKNGLLWLSEKYGISTISYDVGEAMRLDESGIRLGVKGLVKVMRKIGMLRAKEERYKSVPNIFVENHKWVYASAAGFCRLKVGIGAHIKAHQTIATITDPFAGAISVDIVSEYPGIVMGINNRPLVTEGDGLIQIAEIKEKPREVITAIEQYIEE